MTKKYKKVEIYVGMVYKSKGSLLKKQVITDIEVDGINFTKAAIFMDGGVLCIHAFGGGNVSEIGRKIGSMTEAEIKKGTENFLERARKSFEKEK
ncbi:hypothetical protein KBD45_05450 [Candidatus Dojkabacteria bacterium]|nr:hypothetical protein [Candidatus Dojkabacteria bacterium]